MEIEGKSKVYIVVALLLVVFCASFLRPAQVNAAAKKPGDQGEYKV